MMRRMGICQQRISADRVPRSTETVCDERREAESFHGYTRWKLPADAGTILIHVHAWRRLKDASDSCTRRCNELCPTPRDTWR